MFGTCKKSIDTNNIPGLTANPKLERYRNYPIPENDCLVLLSAISIFMKLTQPVFFMGPMLYFLHIVTSFPELHGQQGHVARTTSVCISYNHTLRLSFINLRLVVAVVKSRYTSDLYYIWRDKPPKLPYLHHLISPRAL